MTTSTRTAAEGITRDRDGLVVAGATRRRGARLVLDGVDLAVPRGTIVGLVGGNGAGKTSLLRAIGGRLRLDAGRVTVDGRDIAAARRAGRIGVASQPLAVYPHLTVREHLEVFGRLAGLSPAGCAVRVPAMLDAIGLADRAGAPLHTLSGGMQRRAHVAAAMLHEPALLLLDEPTVGVDADSRARLRTLLLAQRAAGAAVLVATHDLDDAEAVCDRVVVLAAGAVRAAGPVPELVAAAFAASSELAVTVAAAADAARLIAEGFVGAEGGWRRPVGGLDEVTAIERRLAAAGVAVTGWHLHRPTLAGAVARLTDGAVAAERAP